MKKEMLVIDDEPLLCKALGALFAERGFRVTLAGSASEALEKIEQTRADIVLLDLKLPDGSGLEVLSILKKRFPKTRVVVISGAADEATIQEALQRGASDYLAKPFDFNRCFYVAMGVETVDLGTVQVEPEALVRVPASIAKEYRVLPIHWDGTTLRLAMDDPLDKKCLGELKAKLGCAVTPLAVIGGSLAQTIGRHYQTGHSTLATPASSDAERSEADRSDTGAAGGASRGAKPDQDIAALVRDLIHHAHANRATDLHLGIGPKGPWLRERIDGVVYQAPIPSLTPSQYREVVSHLKGMVRLDTGSHKVPQRGRCEHEVDGVALDLSLSVVPAEQGEHLAIRLFEPPQALTVEQLGLTEDQRLNLATLLAKPHGLLLVTGAAGSGRSTTLQACLAKLHTGHANIVTLEDPVERELAGTTQISVQPNAGFTFADGLRAIVHHDPDIIMVGEIPDQETAGLTVRAALTGRLVLSSLHTNDASSTITRLLDLGVEPFFLCSTLTGILSQRLVRKLCEACREPYEVEGASLTHLGTFFPKRTGTVPLWRAKGCKQCRQTGFHGRTGIFELLVVDHQIRSLMIKRTSGIQIRQSAVSRGMMILPQAMWRKIQAGITSLEEMIRSLPPELR